MSEHDWRCRARWVNGTWHASGCACPACGGLPVPPCEHESDARVLHE